MKLDFTESTKKRLDRYSFVELVLYSYKLNRQLATLLSVKNPPQSETFEESNYSIEFTLY